MGKINSHRPRQDDCPKKAFGNQDGLRDTLCHGESSLFRCRRYVLLQEADCLTVVGQGERRLKSRKTTYDWLFERKEC
jgi:hypothetical protein